MRGLGMAGHVGQGFLKNAEQGRTQGRVKIKIMLGQVDPAGNAAMP